MTLPLITVVTVVFNNVFEIENTILSVINQSYPNIEYIIIDGASSDGTVDVIKKYEKNISYWVSEPDDGIYYAMNKGIEKASGEWIIFMNGGDNFYNENVLKSIFLNKNYKGYTVIYGNTEFKKNNIKKILKAGNFKRYWKNNVVHQSVFTRTSFLKTNRFDTNFLVAADYDNYFKILINGKRYLYVDVVISTFNVVGFSHKKKYLGFKERRKTAFKYKVTWDGVSLYINSCYVHVLCKTFDFMKKVLSISN